MSLQRLTSLLFLLTLVGCSRQAHDPIEKVLPEVGESECGGKGQPDCPLQGWMKDSVRAYMNAGDQARLATALDTLAAHPPEGYSGWEMSAKRGADAARAGDTFATKAECKTCHDQFRDRFRAEQRKARLF